MPEPHHVPENARGRVRTSSFWTYAGVKSERWRAGWWDAYDAKRPASTDPAYLAGRAEWIEYSGAGASSGEGSHSMSTSTPAGTAADIECLLIAPSRTNPRKTFDEVKLDELAASIKAHGVLQPIMVRPHPFERGAYELVHGERRWRASVLAGAARIPCIVRELTDLEVIEIQVVENAQRDDLPPLEEAAGYRALMDVGGFSPDEVAAKTGKGVRLVEQRLSLLRLVDRAQAALRDGEITLSVAQLLARVPEDAAQEAALDALKPQYEGAPARTIAEAKRIILGFHTHPLAGAIFDVADATLVPQAGACAACPHRAGNAPRLFGDDVDDDTCTKPACWSEKVAAHGLRLVEGARARGLEVLADKRARTVLGRGDAATNAGGQYALPDEPAYGADESRTWRQVLGKKLPAPTVAAISPNTGKLVELHHRSELLDAARKAGVRIKSPKVAAGMEKAEDTAERDARLEISKATLERVEKLVVQRVRLRAKSREVWYLLASRDLDNATAEVANAALARRGCTYGIDGLFNPADEKAWFGRATTKDLIALVLELNILNGFNLAPWSTEPTADDLAGLEALDISWTAVRKEVVAERKKAAKAAAKKPADAAPDHVTDAGKKVAKKARKRNPWSRMSDAQRLERVNKIRTGKGLPPKAAL